MSGGSRGLPALALAIGGKSLDDGMSRALGRVRVQQRFSAPTLAEVAFGQPIDLLYGDIPALGSSLTIRAADADAPLFDGEVTAVELVYGGPHGNELLVRGYDRLHRLRNRYSARSHAQISVSDLATDLTADTGLSVDAGEGTGPLLRQVIQHGESDLDLLLDLCERCGFYPTVREETLHLMTLAGTGDTVALTMSDNLLQATFEANGTGACQRVSATGWDPRDGRRYEGSATAARSGRDVDMTINPADVGAYDERPLFDLIATAQEEVEARAQAVLDLATARGVRLRGVAEGDPALRPGARVKVDGVADSFAGTYVLGEVTHTIDAERGYLSEISSEPPPPRAPRAGSALTIARVSRVDDPEGLGRVRVQLPTAGNVETDWIQVMSLGGGAHKGLMVMPDVDDDVLVLLAGGDLARGVVLGGVFGVGGAPDPGVDDGAVRRFTLLTPGGHKVLLDDGHKKIRVENGGGSFIELGEDQTQLFSKVELVIEAPGQAVIIRGNTIDFQRK